MPHMKLEKMAKQTATISGGAPAPIATAAKGTYMAATCPEAVAKT